MGESHPPFIHKGIELRQDRIQKLRGRIDEAFNRANARSSEIETRMRAELSKSVDQKDYAMLNTLEATRIELDGVVSELDRLEEEVDQKANKLLEQWLRLEARIQRDLG